MTDWPILLAAGTLAGAMNATAGGGSFVTLPVMIGAGLPSVAANASSTVALYPGGAASAWIYRDGLERVCGVPLRPTLAATLAGGLVGALLLLLTPSALFDRVLPWLLLAATLALMAGPRLGPWLRARFRAGAGTIMAVQLGLGVYGGYYGGAVGVMMLAAWSVLDEADLKTLNPLRMLLVVVANSVAVACFAFAGAVRWPEALTVGAGALAGGVVGARFGRRLPPVAVRLVTVALAAAMTLLFFVRAYR